MGKVYLQTFSESGHVGLRVDFIDFLSGDESCYELIYYEY